MQGEDLINTMKKIFNPMLGRPVMELLQIERVCRIRKPQSIAKETPIVRFHYYEEKAQIWGNLRGATPLRFEGVNLQIFADLSSETLTRRKPLLEQIRRKYIKYNWGFPACLEGRKYRYQPN